MQKTKNRWNIPPAQATQKTERTIERLTVRAKEAAAMISVSPPKFLTLTVPHGGSIPAFQPAGKGTTVLYAVADLRAYIDRLRAEAMAPTAEPYQQSTICTESKEKGDDHDLQ